MDDPWRRPSLLVPYITPMKPIVDEASAKRRLKTVSTSMPRRAGNEKEKSERKESQKEMSERNESTSKDSKEKKKKRKDGE